ncbi:MAG: TatD family hydrolase [Nitrososphaerales archaeon]|nr:TatD family hydrolase [Nitrososphaerales archaeon]
MHLSDYVDPSGVLRFASSSETLLLSSSTSRDTSMITLKFASENGLFVRPFVGVHPSEATEEPSLDWLDKAARRAAGVGEIGLDPKYSEIGERSAQMRVFKEQLSLAGRLGKPVQVHSRGAEAECLRLLPSFSPSAVLLHWFQGDVFAAEASNRGYFVSFGPALLHSKKLQKMASNYAEGLILTESDGPVSFASLGGAGGPWLVPSVVHKLAELWRRSFGETVELLVKNGTAYLAARGKG